MSSVLAFPEDVPDDHGQTPSSGQADEPGDTTAVSLPELLRIGELSHQHQLDELVSQYSRPGAQAWLQRLASVTSPHRSISTVTFLVKGTVVLVVWLGSLVVLARWAPQALSTVGSIETLVVLPTWVQLFRQWRV